MPKVMPIASRLFYLTASTHRSLLEPCDTLPDLSSSFSTFCSRLQIRGRQSSNIPLLAPFHRPRLPEMAQGSMEGIRRRGVFFIAAFTHWGESRVTNASLTFFLFPVSSGLLRLFYVYRRWFLLHLLYHNAWEFTTFVLPVSRDWWGAKVSPLIATLLTASL